MPKGQDITTYYKADIYDLKRGITEANKNIRFAQAEFKAAAAGMDDWSKSSDGISAKLKSLNSVLVEQNKKLENYKKQQSELDKSYSENGKRADELKAKLQELSNQGVSKTSDEYKKYQRELKLTEQEQSANKKASDELKTKILEQQGAINKTEKEIRNYDNTLSQVRAQESRTATETEKLTGKIENQQKELDELKSKYQNVVLSQGKNSSEAKALAKEIETLSTKLKANKDKMDNASSAADGLDKSLSNINTDKANKGFTTLNATLANLIASGIKKVASAITDQLDSAIARVDTINSYKRTMQNLGYANDAVTESTNKMKKGIEGLPTTLPSILSQQQQYAALSGNIDEATNLTIALNNATLAGGQGQDVANSAMQQWYQIIAKGKPDMQSWIIINSAMPAQMNQIAEAVMGAGKKSQDLFSAWQAGKVTTEQVEQAIISLNSSGGSGLSSFQKQALDASGGIETSMTNIKTAISNGLANIIDQIGAENITSFLDSVKKGINEVTPKIAELIKWVIDNKEGVISGIAGISAAMVTLFVADKISKVVSAFKAFKAAQEGATIAQWALNSAMLANPIGLIIALIVGLVTAFVVLWKKSEGFRNFWIGLWDGIKSACSKAWEAIKGFFSSAFDFAKGIWSGITGFFSGLWNGIKDGVSAVWKTIAGIFTSAFNVIVGIWSAILGFFTALWNEIREGATALWEGIMAILSTIADWINTNVIEPIKAFFAPLVDWFTQLFTSIWNFIASVFQVIIQLAQGCWNAIVVIFSVVTGWVNDNIITPVINFFTSLWNTIVSTATAMWETIKAIFITVATWVNDNIITPVVNFFIALWNTIVNTAKAMWEGIKAIFITISSWIYNTVVEPVSNFFTSMWNGLKDGASKAWEGIKSVFSKVGEFFKNTFQNAWQKVKDVFSTGGKIFDGIKEGIVSAFKNIVNGIIRGINKVVAFPFDAINKVLDKIKNVDIFGAKPFDNLIARISVPQIPELERGTVLRKGQVGLLEGNGAEAVVPLERNKYWIKAVASDMVDTLNKLGQASQQNLNNISNTTNNSNFTQNIYANNQPSRLELYRQTKNLLKLANA